MKIRNIALASLLIITSSAFIACGGKSTHTKQVEFLAGIYINLDAFSNNMQAMSDEFDHALDRTDNANINLYNQEAVDSFKNSYQSELEAVQSSIDKIKGMEDMDKKTGIKQKTVDYMTKSKELIRSTMDMASVLLTKGVEGISEEQMKKLSSDMDEMTLMQKQGGELDDALKAFATTNNITDDELKSNGVQHKNIFR